MNSCCALVVRNHATAAVSVSECIGKWRLPHEPSAPSLLATAYYITRAHFPIKMTRHRIKMTGDKKD
jgi:hypothetical protein